MVSTKLAAAVVVAAVLVALPSSGALTTPRTSCLQGKFDCGNGKCITGSRWCDGIDNCDNNADELSCRICLSGSLKCKASNQCVPSGARCNGITECQDGSDEMGCEAISMINVFTTEPSSEESGTSNLCLSTIVLLPTVVLLMR